MNKNIAIGAVIVAVLVGWYWVAAQNKVEMMKEAKMMEDEKMQEKEKMDSETMKKEEMMNDSADMSDEMMKKDEVSMTDKKIDEGEMNKEKMMDKDVTTAPADEEVMKKAGNYVAYAESKLQMAESGDVVLFFKASWCPSCKAVDANIKENLDSIPNTLTILEVDYDNSAALKQKYGVTTQHTFVQVDKNGNLIKKWSGGSTLNSVVAQVE